MKKSNSIVMVIVVIVFAFSYCTTENDDDFSGGNGTARMEIRLADAPTDFDEVNLDIRSISINSTDNEEKGWRELSLLRPGIYNLLDFRNGVDTLLGVYDIPAGEIRQIKLNFGTDSHTMLNGFKSVIFVPVEENGERVIVKHKAQLTRDMTYRLWLDLDAARSLVASGLGLYGPHKLEPVIRTYTDHSGGILEGIVLPPEAKTKIWAIANGDTLLAYPEANGYYRFTGIAPSRLWKIIFEASRLTYYQTVVKDSVRVERDILTVMPVMKHPYQKS